MRRFAFPAPLPLLPLALLALAAGLSGCHRTPHTDWPESGRVDFLESCRKANVKVHEDWLCDCVYAPDGLPAIVSWHEYQAWRDADNARKDPEITHKIAVLNAKCTNAHAKGR